MSNLKAKTCNHYWSYDQPIYSDSKDGVCIRRYCKDCGTKQIGEPIWRPEKEGEFDHEPEEGD